MQKETPVSFSVISITPCTDFLMHLPLFLPLLFHLHVQYVFLYHRLSGKNVFIAKSDCVAITILFTQQL